MVHGPKEETNNLTLNLAASHFAYLELLALFPTQSLQCQLYLSFNFNFIMHDPITY